MTIQTALAARKLIREGKLRQPTCGIAPGYTQANLVILPRAYAFDFLLFCQRNPKPCPIIEVLEPGSYEPVLTTPGADIRTDIPLYRIYKKGVQVEETKDIMQYWNDDMVTFLLGCSFTFEDALIQAGIRLRHIEQGKNISMYITNLQTVPAGIFSGPLVVTMRPIHGSLVARAVQITSRYEATHGAPLHIGQPQTIGICDLGKPDFGDAVEVKADEIPVFWACGVTSQTAALKSKPPLMITHAPGYMFITDRLDKDLLSP